MPAYLPACPSVKKKRKKKSNREWKRKRIKSGGVKEDGGKEGKVGEGVWLGKIVWPICGRCYIPSFGDEGEKEARVCSWEREQSSSPSGTEGLNWVPREIG